MLLTEVQSLSKSSLSCSSGPNLGNVCNSVGTSPAMSIDASLMYYTKTQTYSLGSHLTCRESALVLCHNLLLSPGKISITKRKGRWEKNIAKLLENKWKNSSMPTSSEKLDFPLCSPTLSWSQRPMTNGECAPTILIGIGHAPKMHTLCPTLIG